MKKLTKFIMLLCAVLILLASCGGGGGGGGVAVSDPAADSGTPSSDPGTPAQTPPAATYLGVKAPNEPKAVGDIVFSDGSATPYGAAGSLTQDQKNGAVAYIFYAGGDAQLGSRTLGVGIKLTDEMKQWCRWTSNADCANGYNVNITTIQESDADGSDNLAQIGTFLASHGSSDDTGTAGNYPAFEYAKAYGTRTGASGTWYLPSKAELQKVYEKKTELDAAVVLCGLNENFSSRDFWSSSQYASYDFNAYVLYINGGCWDDYANKCCNYSVCAVRAF